MCEEGERDWGGRTDYRNGSVKTRFCVSYQLSSQSFLISRQTDLSPAPLAGTRDSQPLLSSSLNDKKMLFGELMVTDMAP